MLQLDRHEQWVKTGEDPEGDLYPLEPGAYRTEESEDAVGTSSTTGGLLSGGISGVQCTPRFHFSP